MTIEGAQTAYAYPLSSSQTKKPIDKNSDLYKACVDFESLFLKQMLDVMRKSVPKEGLLGGSLGQDIYEDMLYDEYAKKMAETAQFGIAEAIYTQVSSKA
jgi:flagellar protein FlgJ